MEEIFPLEHWPAVVSSFILCREDRTVRPEWLRKAVRDRRGVTAIELPGGHCLHVSRPAELADVLSGLV
jgi:hypothetical protein